MTDNNKIIDMQKAKKRGAIASRELLPKIFTTFATDLKPKLIACFESLDDTLFDLAEKADSNQKQTLYFESMRDVRKNRDRVFKSFFESIQSTFKSFKKGDLNYFDNSTAYNENVKSLSLSLIDEKELDETLAKTNLINKSDMAYHRQLFALKKRLAVLTSEKELKASHLPVGPHIIVNSFSICIQSIDLDVTLKLIMYKLFERNVMGQLNETYKKINGFLSDKGIIPEISYNIGRSSSASTQNSQINTSNNINDLDEKVETINANENNSAQQLSNNQEFSDPNYQIISQLFKNTHQNSSESDTNNPAGNSELVSNNANVQLPNIDITSMMNALSILQSDLFKNIKIDEQSNQSPTEIKEELLKQLHKLDSETKDKTVLKKDEDTIDLVGMLFQFIVDDRNLPDAIQVLLAKLQIPYLKIALEDRNVFADKTHNARALLDKLSLASIGWTQESDNKNIFINKIESIVKSILEMEEYKEEFFSDINEEFNEFRTKLKKKSDVAQKRTKEKSLGQDKIQQAKEKSAKLLVDKMTNKQMPILIRDILLGEWSNVLILMHLRHKKSSPNFIEKISFIDKVIKYSLPNKENPVTREEITAVSEIYKSGLMLVAFNSKEQIDKLNSLSQCLNSIHNLENDIQSEQVELIPPEEILKLSDIRSDKHEIVDFIEEIIEPTSNEDFEHVDDKYAEVISSLKVGTWLEFSREDSNSIRAKLSWISPITGKFLFVNSRGLKIVDKTELALADGLRNKSIRVLQQVALFDRALSAIADKLKKDDTSTPREVEKTD